MKIILLQANSLPLFTMSNREDTLKVESGSTCLLGLSRTRSLVIRPPFPRQHSSVHPFFDIVRLVRAVMTVSMGAPSASSVPTPKASIRTTRSLTKQIQQQQNRMGLESVSGRTAKHKVTLTAEGTANSGKHQPKVAEVAVANGAENQQDDVSGVKGHR